MSEEEIKDGFAPAILVNDEGEIDGFGEVHDPDEGGENETPVEEDK